MGWLCQVISAHVKFCDSFGSSKSLFGLVILERDLCGLLFLEETITTLNIIHTPNDGACPEEEGAEPRPEMF